MTAISFFSYKGGVGRTMALTNMAMRLVEFGKSVLIIDFDLEAPGVPYKLGKYLKPDDIKTGVVDYIHEFSSKGQLDDIKKYVMDLPRNNPGDAPMWLLPAGNTNMSEYWNKLSRINWHDMFYKEGGKGVRFFMDLKEKLRKQYNPDFILIDSRTGITELSGISLKILADEVVLMFVKNDENIKGTERVLEFLYGENEQEPKVNLVLTRIPDYNNTIGFNHEYKLLKGLSQQFAHFCKGVQHNILVIHTDDRLQMNEKLGFIPKRDEDEKPRDIYAEHLILFEKLFKEKISPEAWLSQQRKAEAAKIYENAINTDNIQERIIQLNRAINLDNQKWEFYSERGRCYSLMCNYQKAIEDYKKSVQLSSESADVLLTLAWVQNDAMKSMEALRTLERYLNIFGDSNEMVTLLKGTILNDLDNSKDALETVNEGLSKYENSAHLLNLRANIFRKLKDYNNALMDVFKAISIDPEYIFYSTLAEIYASMNRDDEFYLNIATALSNGMKTHEVRSVRDVYERFRYDERFIELLRSYNQNSEDIFHDGPPTTGEHDYDLGDDVLPS